MIFSINFWFLFQKLVQIFIVPLKHTQVPRTYDKFFLRVNTRRVENWFSEAFGVCCGLVVGGFEILRGVVWGWAEGLIVGGDCAGEGLGLGWVGGFDWWDTLVEGVLGGFEVLIVFD